MTAPRPPEMLRDFAQSINSPLSTAERGAVLAFAAIDGIAFTLLAFPYAIVKGTPHDSFEPDFFEAFLCAGSYFGFWFGALALPVAVFWIAMAPKAERRHTVQFEFTRTLLVTSSFVFLLALTTTVVGPDSYGGYVIHWHDAKQFGTASLYCCIAALPLCAMLRPLATWWFADAMRTPKIAPPE